MPGIWMKRRVLPTNYTNLHEKTIGSWFSQASPIKTTAGFSIKSELSLFRHPAIQLSSYPAIQLSSHPAISPSRPLLSSRPTGEISLQFFPPNSELIAQHSALSSSQSPVPITLYPPSTAYFPLSTFPVPPTQHSALSSSQSPVPSTQSPVPPTRHSEHSTFFH